MSEDRNFKIDFKGSVDPLAAATEMTDAFREFSTELRRINDNSITRDKKRKHSIRFLALSLVVDIALTVVVGLLFNNVHAEQVNACHKSNNNRVIDKDVWDTVLNKFLVPNPDTTIAQAKQTRVVINGLEAQIAYSYRQQPC